MLQTAALPTELSEVVRVGGFEPPVSWLQTKRINQIFLYPVVSVEGLEPPTP